jgi:predicted dehydrogenase
MTTPNRRTFLKGSAMASVPLFSAARAHAARSASNTVVVGVMGLNGRGTGLAAGFSSLEGCEVGYVCDVDRRTFARAAKAISSRQKPTPKEVTDFRRILDDKTVDALVIAAPDHWHGPAAILACAAGKHVYVEKPASHNGREGMLMIEAARKHDRRVQMGTQRRSWTKVIEAIERLKRGEIGRVLFARGWINSTRPSIGRGRDTQPHRQLDYALWQGPAAERPYRENVIHYHWHWFWHWGTGELGNNGVHALDLCRWGLGVDYPNRVVCGGGKFHFDDDQETPDTQLATFHFGDRAIHWEHRTWHRRGFENALFGATFYGESGALVIADEKYTVFEMDGRKREEVKLDQGDASHLANFLAAVRGGSKLNCEIEEGVKTTTLCHLGNIAYRTGNTVNFDPDKREITSDPAAQQFWTREYRPGWEPIV